MTGRGFYKMHRGWMRSPDFKPGAFCEPLAFCWSIEAAAFSPHLQWFNGHQFPVERGQFVTSYRALAEAFGWSVKRARSFGTRMVKAGKWTLEMTHLGAHGPTLLTVLNYEKYQTRGEDEGTVQGAPRETAADTGRDTAGDTQQKNSSEKNGEEGKKERAPALPYAAALEAWRGLAAENRWTPLDPTLGDKRRRGLSAILSKHGLEGWSSALARAAASPLLRGPDPPAWFTFDFITKPDNFLKVRDGNYDKQFSDSRGQQPSGWGGAYSDTRWGMPC